MLGGWWFAEFWEWQPGFAIGWAFWVVFSVTLHELGHGWAAIRQGDDTPIHTGHMTWNPLVHMGPTSLIIFAVVGLAWGLMPVNPSRFRHRYGDAIVSFAGPLMNFSLAITLAIASAAWPWIAGQVGAQDQLRENMFDFLFAGVSLNLALGVFNLVPVPPLDGSRILASLYPPFGRLWERDHAPVIGLVLFAGVFFLVGPRLYEYAMIGGALLIAGIQQLA